MRGADVKSSAPESGAAFASRAVIGATPTSLNEPQDRGELVGRVVDQPPAGLEPAAPTGR